MTDQNTDEKQKNQNIKPTKTYLLNSRTKALTYQKHKKNIRWQLLSKTLFDQNWLSLWFADVFKILFLCWQLLHFFGVFSFLNNTKLNLTTRFTGATLRHNLMIFYNHLHKLKFRTKAQPCGCVRYNRKLETQKLICTEQKNKKLWQTKTLTENRKSKNKTCQNHTFWIADS